jgi:amino acid adenylation domain-containing protein
MTANKKAREYTGDEIAVIGMAGRFPGARDIHEFWENLSKGVEATTRITAEDLRAGGVDPAVLNDPDYVRDVFVLEGAEDFDAAYFGFTPGEAEMMDPQHRLFLETATAALDHAGYDPDRYEGAIGVFGGVGRNSHFLHALARRPELFEAAGEYHALIGNERDFPATHVSYRLNLRGPSVTVQSACSTSGVAVHVACASLRTGDCDIALAGGCKVIIPNRQGYFHIEGGPLAPEGHVRAFDADAKGMVRGSGAAVLVLKRLEDALADGDTVYGLVVGSAVNNDGSAKVGFTAPSVSGQAAVIAEAIESAGLTADAISYVEAHGTGTVLGDPIEIAGLTEAFRQTTDRTGFCAIGSVKTNIGHLDAGATAAGIVKTLLAFRNELLPASLNFKRPNPGIPFETTPFRVNGKASAWPRGPEPRRAGVSSFGLGGTNAHVILEEPPAAEAPEPGKPFQLLVLSARDEKALDETTANLAKYLRDHPSVSLPDAAYTLQVGRRHWNHRRALVVRDVTDATEALASRDAARMLSNVRGGDSPTLVYMFPGGGAQYPRMAAGLYASEPVFREAIDRCEALLPPQARAGLRGQLTGDKAAADLERPSIALPALFAVEYALSQLWTAWGLAPSAMIGHSMGEYAAACVSGVFSVEDAMRLVLRRGELFERLEAGGMVSVPLSEAELQPFLNDSLSIAAINRPSSCVASGPTAAIDALIARLEERDIDSTRIHISVAAHSKMVEPILEEFGAFLAEIRLGKPKIPFVSNVTGTWITAAEAQDPKYWVKHLRQTVRFADGLATLFQDPSRVLLEVGPGQTLSTFARQHPGRGATQAVVASLRHPQETVDDNHFLTQSIGRLWLAGLAIDFDAMHQDARRRRVELPTYPFQRQHYSLATPRNAAERVAHAALPAPAAIVEPPEPLIPIPPAASPAPSPISVIPPTMSAPTAPRGDRIVAELRKIVQELSGMDPARLDPNATFLELGFDSLFLARANSAFKKRFNVKLTTRQLMEKTPSLGTLGAHLDKELPPTAFAEAPAAAAPVPAPAAALAAPVTPAATISAPMLGGVGAGSLLESVIAQQMQLMQAQLAALSGGAVAPLAAAPVAAVNAAPVQAAKPAIAAPPPAVAPPAPDKTSPWQPVAKGGGADASFTPEQRRFLDALIDRVTKRTPKSKALTQANRAQLADPRTVQGFRKQWKEIVYPIVSDRAKGSKIWDVDGNEYIDLVNGYGVTFFGHAPDFILDAVRAQLEKTLAIGPQTELAGEVAKLICEITGMERAAFCNTGSEAVLAAIRTARTVTGKTKLATFAGHYHGIFDEVLVKGTGNGAERSPVPIAPGIPANKVQDVVVLEYGNMASLDVIRKHADDLALVMVEPVRSRNLDLQPREFLHALRKVTEELGIPLLFDEMVTGFRAHPGGAQAHFGVRADLATYGKVVGGEFPIGVVTGRKEYLDALDGGMWSFGDNSTPEADMTWFAGTFVRHPLALAAAKAVLTRIKEGGPEVQASLNARTTAFVKDLNAHFEATNAPIRFEHFASSFILTFPSFQDYSALLFYDLHTRGVYTYEGRPAFFTLAHSDADFAHISNSLKEAVADLQNVGLFPGGPVRRAGEAFEVPLTENQQEVWVGTQFGDEASSAFNLSIKLPIRGRLDVPAMRTALQQLVDRHEALRTTFTEDGERQRIHPKLAIDTPVIDLTDLPEGERDARANALELAAIKVPYDLVKGPLVRTSIVKLADDRWRVLFLVHHIVADGWSCGVLSRDLGVLYQAVKRGTKPELKPLMQLSEYVRHLGEEEQVAAHAASEEFWLKEYATLPPALALPTDRPRPAFKSFEADRIFMRLDAPYVNELKQAATKHGATMFAFSFAAFDAYLARLTGQDDLVVGFDLAGQALVQGRDLVSHAVSFLPMRATVDVSKPFARLVQDVRGKLFDVLENQTFTYGSLLKKIRVPIDPSRKPLVSVSFNLDPSSLGLHFDDLEVASDSIPRQFENNELFVNMVQLDDGGIELQCTYNKDLFDAETVRRRMREFVVLMGDAARHPDKSVASLDIMPPDERKLVVETWNDTRVGFAENATVHELIEAQVAASAKRVAVIADSGVAKQLTYAELNRRADALASRLQAMGVGPDMPVAVSMDRSAELVVSLLAVMKSGGAYVPVDPGYPEQRRRFMIEDCGARVILTQKALRHTLPTGPAIVSVDEIWSELVDGKPEPRATADNVAYMIYTSGSTGMPKGVMVEHRSIVNRLEWQNRYLGVGVDDVILQKTPYSFDVSVWEFFSPLMAGARLVMARPEGHKDPSYLLEAITTHGVTITHFVPSMLQAIVGEPDLKRCTSLRHIVCSGEALSPTLRDRLLEVLPVELHNLYGPTEAAVDVSAAKCVRNDPPWTVPIGRPVANTTLYVLDADLQPVPIGVPGELYIGGVQVGRGYMNRPELTAERFVRDPFSRNGGRLYRTGDLSRFLSDGQIEFLGRLDNQVKIRGFRIELGEIEAAIEKQHNVRQAVVAVKELSPGDQSLVAYLTSKNGAAPDPSSLRSALASSLPDYMVPQHWMVLPEMPLTSSGKVDRKALPLPQRGAATPRAFVAPKGDVQEKLAAIWADVLGIARVGADDDFFDLGGHSILATRVVSRVRRDFGVQLPLRTIFTAPKLVQLANELDSLLAVAALAGNGAGGAFEEEVVL